MENPVSASQPLASFDVLFVDDDPDISQVMTAFLRRAGYAVEEAANGQAALKILHHHPVGVVVTDILMPQVDGYELIIKLRHTPHRPRIIATSGNPSKIGLDFLKSAQQLGADRVLAKPYMPQVLLKLVQETIGAPKPPAAPST